MSNPKSYSRMGFILSLLLLSFFSGFHFGQMKRNSDIDKQVNELMEQEKNLHNRVDSLCIKKN